MAEKRTDAKTGIGSAAIIRRTAVKLDDARQALPGLVRDSSLFDLDYDPSELARMKQIFRTPSGPDGAESLEALEVCDPPKKSRILLPFPTRSVSRRRAEAARKPGGRADCRRPCRKGRDIGQHGPNPHAAIAGENWHERPA
jgi:hypothetical protein